jgi:hypothetical protein
VLHKTDAHVNKLRLFRVQITFLTSPTEYFFNFFSASKGKNYTKHSSKQINKNEQSNTFENRLLHKAWLGWEFEREVFHSAKTNENCASNVIENLFFMKNNRFNFSKTVLNFLFSWVLILSFGKSLLDQRRPLFIYTQILRFAQIRFEVTISVRSGWTICDKYHPQMMYWDGEIDTGCVTIKRNTRLPR